MGGRGRTERVWCVEEGRGEGERERGEERRGGEGGGRGERGRKEEGTLALIGLDLHPLQSYLPVF
jgi:hypothetical protein